MQWDVKTDIGLIREENQDQVKAEEFSGRILAVVCDGMGGERSGSQASKLAIRELFDRFKAGFREDLSAGDIRALLLSSVSAANSVIYTTSRMDYRSYGMGTTCVAAYVDEGYIYLASVGDSRAYLVENGTIRQLTNDHTVVNELLHQGKITPEEAVHHPQKNMLTRAVGVERVIKPDYLRTPCAETFQLLLCSDGLSGYCTEEEIFSIMQKHHFDGLIQALMDLALEKGGRDNISLAIVTS
ncbi:MAG: Stp1/IreP family PP2C-type Ser/Thr phosphatase [Oscillospiraceae bacterium]